MSNENDPDFMTSWPTGGLDTELERLQTQYFPTMADYDPAGLLNDPALTEAAVVSSFGAESAVLLHFVTRHRPKIPVLFIDTGKHFTQTLIYRDMLTEVLGLNLKVIIPDAAMIAAEDAHGRLHARDPNACCVIRKTFPLQDALVDYSSWISGRKRFQGYTRASLPLVERDGKRIKVNPLALWAAEDIATYFDTHTLPRHPLEKRGFPSIGCAPCTRAVAEGEDLRAGRWPQMPDKTECGIHLGPDGHFVRTRD